MAGNGTCPKCGARLPGDAPQGLCPACLMGFGLGEESTGAAVGGEVDGAETRPAPTAEPFRTAAP